MSPGPPIGADLLHLAEIEQRAVGMASIGGAGTLEGILISGVVAAYDMMPGASLAVCYQGQLEFGLFGDEGGEWP